MCPFRSIPWTSRVCEVRSTDHAADVTDYRRRIASRKTLVSAAFHRCPSWPCPTAAGELPAHDPSVTSNVADRVRSDAGPAARSRTAGRPGTAGDPRGRAPARRQAPPTGASIFSASAAWFQPDPRVTAAPKISTRRLAPAIASARCCTRTGSGQSGQTRSAPPPAPGPGPAGHPASATGGMPTADTALPTCCSVTGPEGRAGAGSMCAGSMAASGVGWGALPPRVGGRSWT